jgi:outer membrane biosynthesis protein TonB
MIEFDDRHPYFSSFAMACIIILWAIFHTPSTAAFTEVTENDSSIQFIDIEQIQSSAPKRVFKQEITTDKSVSESETDVQADRAHGVSDDASAVDISFYPNVAPPKLVGRLKKIYPKSARELNIEATVQVELYIDGEGIVRNVKIIGIRLSQAMPDNISTMLTKDFTRDAIAILKGEQYTPPVVNGKKVPIKMTLPLKFELK